MGVNIMCDSNVSMVFAAAQMSSPTGKSHTFDTRANGYARGEACSCAVMLPDSGSQSVRCEASAVRQDGKSASLTAPNGTAQQALIRAGLQSAGRSSDGAYILESHGTGTSLGDPIEARAMCAIREDPQLMNVQGCKANVGHTEPAAGVTGVLQLTMTMGRSAMCQNAQLRVLNPHIGAVFNGRSPSLPVQPESIDTSAAEM
eukprot:4855476-Prymnesium_polylepis.1